MADDLAQARHDLAVANRVVALEGIIDAFGHVSMRHPTKPDRYLISRSRSPEVVEASDIYEFTLDSEPVTPLPQGIRGYGELVIHGEIYKARPDVNAVSHHHNMAMLPFCNTGEELVPLYHMGAQIGEKVPFWDSRDEFGDTSLLVLKPEEGRSLARALGPNWLVLMRRHGATVAAKNLTELVFRSIYSVRNAELQLTCKAQGQRLSPLTPGEAKLAMERNLQPRPQARAWEYWSTRLRKAGEYPGGAPKTKTASAAKSRGAKIPRQAPVGRNRQALAKILVKPCAAHFRPRRCRPTWRYPRGTATALDPSDVQRTPSAPPLRHQPDREVSDRRDHPAAGLHDHGHLLPWRPAVCRGRQRGSGSVSPADLGRKGRAARNAGWYGALAARSGSHSSDRACAA